MTIKGKKYLWGKSSQAWVSGSCQHGDLSFSFTEKDMIDGEKSGLSLLELELERKSNTLEAILLVEAIIIKDISQGNENLWILGPWSLFACSYLAILSPSSANPRILSVSLLRDSACPVYI